MDLEKTIKNKESVEASDNTSAEILELKKKLAEDFIDKLLENNSDSMNSIKKLAIKNYLIDENTPEDIFIDNFILGGFGEMFGLIPQDIKKYREMFSEASTKNKLEELRKTIFSEVGGTEQVSTTTRKSNTPDETSTKSTGKTKEDEEVVNNNGIVGKACQIAVDIANDNSYGYELGGTENNNGKKGFDCQSFVRHCYIKTGINVPPSGGCGTMKRDFEKVGFECITFNKNMELKPGDILVDPKKHTEMCVGENKIAGAHSNKDRKAGDGDGEEISVRSVKSSLSYWNPQFILRYKG